MKKTRRKFSAAFKTKVVLEVLKERHSISELAQQFEVHPNQLSAWKKEFLENAEKALSDESGNERFKQAEKDKEELFKQIGQLKVENDWLKKKVL
jgi:transposase-like protein